MLQTSKKTWTSKLRVQVIKWQDTIKKLLLQFHHPIWLTIHDGKEQYLAIFVLDRCRLIWSFQRVCTTAYYALINSIGSNWASPISCYSGKKWRSELAIKQFFLLFSWAARVIINGHRYDYHVKPYCLCYIKYCCDPFKAYTTHFYPFHDMKRTKLYRLVWYTFCKIIFMFVKQNSWVRPIFFCFCLVYQFLENFFFFSWFPLLFQNSHNLFSLFVFLSHFSFYT